MWFSKKWFASITSKVHLQVKFQLYNRSKSQSLNPLKMPLIVQKFHKQKKSVFHQCQVRYNDSIKSIFCDIFFFVIRLTISHSVLLTETDTDTEDNLAEFLVGPSASLSPVPNKVLKRRNTVSVVPSEPEFSVRKDSRVVHSSVLAISNRPKTINKALPEPVTTSSFQSTSSGKPFLSREKRVWS